MNTDAEHSSKSQASPREGWGCLYGVGVGPGAADLVTLRAIEVLRRVEVIVIPRSNPWIRSVAWEAVRGHLSPRPNCELLPLTFPMSRDPVRVRAAWEVAWEEIEQRLAQKRSVAFISEGDPLLYSSFVYLLREAPRRWPQVRIEVVPAVSSLTAVPAACGIPLADGGERIAILPATYGLEDLAEALDRFDTVIVMKIGPHLPQIVETLRARGLLADAVYVSHATLPGERIERQVERLGAQRGDCLAMLLIAPHRRSGALLGDVAAQVFSAPANSAHKAGAPQ